MAVLLLAAVNLRAPFVGVSAVADPLREALGVGSGAVGLLTGIPTLCFGLAAPLGLWAVRRYGAEGALAVGLAGIVVGTVLRSLGSFPVAIAGTVVIGLAITVGNIVVPVLIRRRTPPDLAGAVTGAYVVALNLGATAALLGTGPLVGATGWRTGLAAPALLAVVSLVVWWLVVGRSSRGPAADDVTPPPPVGGPLLRQPVVWLLAVAFAGQATSYYSVTAWLPSVLSDEVGASGGGGALASLFQVSAVIGALGTPLLARRLPEWGVMVVLGVCWVSFPVLLLLAPEAYLVGAVVGGAAQGGGFAAIFTIIVRVGRDDRESAATSAFVQGVGYTVAALGPPLVGAVHDVTLTWTAPLLVVVGSTATFALAGTAAALSARRRTGPAPAA